MPLSLVTAMMVYMCGGVGLAGAWAVHMERHRQACRHEDCLLCGRYSWMSGLMAALMITAIVSWPAGLLYRLLIVAPYLFMIRRREAHREPSGSTYRDLMRRTDEQARRELAEEERQRMAEGKGQKEHSLAEENASQALTGRHRPGALQGWFAQIAKMVPILKVVPPPTPNPPVIAVKGFWVPCSCRTGLMTTMNFPTRYPSSISSPPPPATPGANCKKCGDRGYVFVQQG